MVSSQPRKQRKALAEAPGHVRRKQVASHLSEDLLLKYNRRSLSVIKGDEVKILRGGRKGKTGKVLRVDTKARKIVIEGITHKKADGTDVALPVDPSNVLITRLNLEDKRRRAKLGEKEEPKKAKKAAKSAEPTEKPAKAEPANPVVSSKESEAKAAEKTEEVTA